MATLIKLTTNKENSVLYVNPDHITTVEETKFNGTSVTINEYKPDGPGWLYAKHVYVKEDPNTIIWLMKNS